MNKTKLAKFLHDNPSYAQEAQELAMNGETYEDIYNYLNADRLRKLNDKLLTEMGI